MGLIRVGNHRHGRHPSGEREGQNENYGYVFHGGALSAKTNMPEAG